VVRADSGESEDEHWLRSALCRVSTIARASGFADTEQDRSFRGGSQYHTSSPDFDEQFDSAHVTNAAAHLE